jgi:hypothetical protein
MKHVGLAWKRNGYQSERLPIPRSQPRSSFRPRRCSSVLRCPDLSDGVPEWFRGSSVVSLPDILRVLDFKQAESTGVPPPISATVRPFIRFRHLSLMGCSILVHHPRSANSRSISPDFHIRFPPFPIVSSWPSPPERACPVLWLAGWVRCHRLFHDHLFFARFVYRSFSYFFRVQIHIGDTNIRVPCRGTERGLQQSTTPTVMTRSLPKRPAMSEWRALPNNATSSHEQAA